MPMIPMEGCEEKTASSCRSHVPSGGGSSSSCARARGQAPWRRMRLLDRPAQGAASKCQQYGA